MYWFAARRPATVVTASSSNMPLWTICPLINRELTLRDSKSAIALSDSFVAARYLRSPVCSWEPCSCFNSIRIVPSCSLIFLAWAGHEKPFLFFGWKQQMYSVTSPYFGYCLPRQTKSFLNKKEKVSKNYVLTPKLVIITFWPQS